MSHLGSPTHVCKNMHYRRNYKTDNVLPGQGYHIHHGPVTQEFNGGMTISMGQPQSLGWDLNPGPPKHRTGVQYTVR